MAVFYLVLLFAVVGDFVLWGTSQTCAIIHAIIINKLKQPRFFMTSQGIPLHAFARLGRSLNVPGSFVSTSTWFSGIYSRMYRNLRARRRRRTTLPWHGPYSSNYKPNYLRVRYCCVRSKHHNACMRRGRKQPEPPTKVPHTRA